eukprot:UN01115
MVPRVIRMLIKAFRVNLKKLPDPTLKTEIPRCCNLTELVLFQRSEKSILVKMTSFCVFQPSFKIFQNSKKSETSNLL